MGKKKISGISAGRNLTIGDVSGQFAAGENITQTQTLSVSDKKELLDCLIQFQKETAKLGSVLNYVTFMYPLNNHDGACK